MIVLYGIKNCDTVKKARRWLDQHHIQYRYHDFRDDGITYDQIKHWGDQLGWKTMVNKRSTAWKMLEPSLKAQLELLIKTHSESTPCANGEGFTEESGESRDNQCAIDAILQLPTLIKRPLLETQKTLCVGFNAADYQALFL